MKPEIAIETPQALEPPRAPKIPHEIRLHGRRWSDPYFWLRNRDSPEVLAYLKAENAYTDAVMKSEEESREILYREILGRIRETDLSVPVRIGPYFYYSRTEKGKSYPVYCRKKTSLENPEAILLDLNVLAEGRSFFALGAFAVSPDHDLLAYSTDLSGSESYTLRIRDLKTGTDLPEAILNASANAVWAETPGTLLYTTLDAAKRPHRLYLHALRTDPAADRMIYEEPDEAFSVSVSKSKSRKFIFLDLHSKSSSEVRYTDAARPEGPFSVFAPRRPQIEYEVVHHANRFLIVTNEKAVNFRLLEAPVEHPGPQSWKEILPHRPRIKLEGVEAFQDFLVLYEREEGLTRIRIEETGSGQTHLVPLPDPAGTAWGGQNPEYTASFFRFGYTSLVTPDSIFDYEIKTRVRTLKKQTEVLGGYDPARYASRRIFAVSHDGTRVPLSLVWRRDGFQRGENPLYLAGYGAYGISYDPEFSTARLSLLDRGVVCAIAHLRGGGDLGRPWYEDGKLLRKKNTFRDFIACAEHLVREGYVHPKRIAITGGSAGGLLIGNVLNECPGLFHAAVAKVPFVDLVHTMLDKTLPLTVAEFDEWGNPEDPRFFRYLRSYSPYDNVRRQAYPHLFITAGLNDPRVQYWEPAKWAAKLRAIKTGAHLLLLKTDLGAGHGGPSGRYDALKEITLEYAFLLHCFGIRAGEALR